MLRPLEHLGRAALLDDLALAHDVDPVGHAAHDAEVVGDEQHGHAELALQRLQQLEDLRLDGDVERGGRLVGDQQVGLVGERHGDHDALALAAGELMRDRRCSRRSGLSRPTLRSSSSTRRARRGVVEAVVQLHDLADLLLDGVQRVERGHRLLEDDRDLLAADLAHVMARRLEQVLAAEADLAGGMRGRRIGQQPQDRQRRDGLARARFADQRHDLALGDVEGDVLDGVDDGRRRLANRTDRSRTSTSGGARPSRLT